MNPLAFLAYSFYFSNTIGQDLYLWVIGGKTCVNSKEVLTCFLDKTGRWLANASQMIKRKNITDTNDTIDPILANKFHFAKASG